MTLKASAFIAASLDGFIAREDGNLDWLHAMSSPGEDYGYAAFMATVDVIVMGRLTYEKVLTFGTWPYGGKRLIVSRIPVLIGTGIPLFGPTPKDLQLRHIRTQHYPTGLVQSEYEVLGATGS